VVIRSLPEIPATLWLRGLGKDQILTQAFADIRELPGTRRERNDIVEVCIKHFKYLTEKPPSSLSEEEEDFMKTMQEIDAIYKSEMSQARLEGEVRGRQEGRQEGRKEGRQEGRKEGRQEGRQEQGYLLVLRQLPRRVGNVSIDLQERVRSLPLEKVEMLGEDLLDFAQLGDLLAWFEKNK
jgi:predicted transposase YdaD